VRGFVTSVVVIVVFISCYYILGLVIRSVYVLLLLPVYFICVTLWCLGLCVLVLIFWI